jgi:hypothetical protein
MERGDVYTEYWWGNRRKGDHFEDSGLQGKIILKLIFEKWVGGMDWINLALDRDR